MNRLVIFALVGALCALATPAVAGDWHTGASLICADCHVMHGSQEHAYSTGGVFVSIGPNAPYEYLLRNEVNDLCLSCHDREYTKGAGKVANMKELLAKNAIHHGPIKQKDCSGCHNAHGSKNFRMLREYFPDAFYAGYNPNNYKLCFMCHEKALASEERTTTMTGFRDGDRNLHAVHVNKTVKGRTCRACQMWRRSCARMNAKYAPRGTRRKRLAGDVILARARSRPNRPGR